MGKIILTLVLAATMSMAQGGGTGLGIVIGEPAGLTGKFWLGNNVALDAAAAWSISRHKAVHFHADILYHNFNMSNVAQGWLPAYVGIGGRFKLAGPEKDQHPRMGVRMPFGLEYLFAGVPVGLFIEAAPTLNFLTDIEFDINGGLGARWYFR